LHENDKALGLVRRAYELERDSRDPRALSGVASPKEPSSDPDGRRKTWTRLRDVLEQRLADNPDQTRNRFVLLQALRPARENAGRHGISGSGFVLPWIRPAGASRRTCRLAVAFLARIGERAEAERFASGSINGGIYASNDYDFRMLRAESDDPVVERYLASGVREIARRRAVYVRP
jgi:hypothetical protein